MWRSGTMMHHLKLFLMLVLFSQQRHCQKIECGISYPHPYVKYKNLIVQVNNTGPCEMWDIDMEVMNGVKVDVSFRVTSRNCSLYRFQLKGNESMNEMNCVNTSRKYLTNTVSEMNINLQDKPTGPCEEITCVKGEVVNVTFEDIPSGCYKLHYCTLRSESSETCGQLVRYLNTGIKVNQKVKYEVPTLTPQPLQERNEVGITLSRFTTFSEIQLTVRPVNNTTNCTPNSDKRLTVWVARAVNGSLMCKRNTGTSNCHSHKYQTAENEHCNKIECYEDTEQKSIKCEFKNIPPGNYCVNMDITGPHSKGPGYYQKFEMQHPIMPPEIPDQPVSFVYLVVMIAIVFLLFTSIAIMVVICRRRWNNPLRVVIADDDHSWLQSPEILLLYPRDCKEFMKMMVSCREIMEEKTGCKVYDCFDSHHTEDLSLNKEDWMRRHVLRHNMKVVVVETPCAVLHQRASVENSRLTYKEPTWLDGLFLFGLKLLTDNPDRNNYQKVFVVCVDGFTGERDTLNSLTSYRRYVIPQSLDQLLEHLNVQNFHSIVKMKDYENENVQRLEHDLRNLINYRGQNLDYLQQLLSLA